MINKSNFKQTEIGMIPEDWEVRVIGEIVKINEDTINKNYNETDIEYIDTSSVDKGHLVETQKLKLEEAPSRAKRIIKDNDILISTVRPNLRHFFFVKKSKKNLIGSTGFAVISPKKINPEFLYYYLTTDNYTNFLTAIADAHTSTYPSFNPEVIETSFCPFPEKNEQSAIAKILSSLDSKIELNHQMNKTLEVIGQTIFKRWFIDFEFPNEKGKPYKSSGGEMVDSELGKIPKGWKTGKVGDCIEFAYGKGLPETKRQNGVYPVLGSNGIIGSHSEYLVKGPGIVVGRKGTLGEVYWIDKNFFPIDTTFYVVDKLKVGSLYFHYFMLKGKDFLKSSSDSAVPGLNRTIASSQDMIIPSNNIISQFNTSCINLFNRKYILSIQSENLSQIRDSLLPKLMSGKIRVPVEVKQ